MCDLDDGRFLSPGRATDCRPLYDETSHGVVGAEAGTEEREPRSNAVDVDVFSHPTGHSVNTVRAGEN